MNVVTIILIICILLYIFVEYISKYIDQNELKLKYYFKRYIIITTIKKNRDMMEKLKLNKKSLDRYKIIEFNLDDLINNNRIDSLDSINEKKLHISSNDYFAIILELVKHHSKTYKLIIKCNNDNDYEKLGDNRKWRKILSYTLGVFAKEYALFHDFNN